MFKRIFIYSVGALLMASCARDPYCQVFKVSSTNVKSESGNYIYDDENCSIIYNFWTSGGNPGFVIKNKSTNTIYVDLTNTFLVTNEHAQDYYLNRTFSKGYSSSSSKTAGISRGVAGSVSASGIYNAYSGTGLAGKLGSVAAGFSSSTSRNSSVTVSNGTSSGVTYTESPVVTIPPKSYKTISEYILVSDVLQDCQLTMLVKKNAPSSLSYNEETTPIRFANHITYYVGEDKTAHKVENNFYISQITNYHPKDVYEKIKYGCINSVKGKINKLNSGMSFYVNYNEMHSRLFSKDAKRK